MPFKYTELHETLEGDFAVFLADNGVGGNENREIVAISAVPSTYPLERNEIAAIQNGNAYILRYQIQPARPHLSYTSPGVQGLLNVHIYTLTEGTREYTAAADRLDEFFQAYAYEGRNLWMGTSYLNVVGIDSDEPSLHHVIYSVPFIQHNHLPRI